MSNKNLIILASGTVTLVLIVLNSIGNFTLCGSVEWGSCIDYLANLETAFLPLIPLFIFSAVTYFMPERVFKAWAKFAVIWIPLSMLAILVAPEYDGAFIPLFPVIKGTVAFGMSAFFALISTVLIGIQYYGARRN